MIRNSQAYSHTVLQWRHTGICHDMCVISAKRERRPDEIIPVSVEHSQTLKNNEEKFAAAHAIDLDLETRSSTSAGSDGKIWFKVNLAKLNCIHQAILYNDKGDPFLTSTCTSSNCSPCEGSYCKSLLITTSSEKTLSDDLPLIADCKYGDTVKVEKLNGGGIGVPEIAITGKQGEIRYLL